MSLAEPKVVETQNEIEKLCSELRSTGWFAFDTEFVGEDRYQPEICLLQVSTESMVALLDPLAGTDTRPIWELVADPEVLTLVHAGAEDLSLCPIQVGRIAANVVDLQIAAGMAGMGYPMNLARICRVAAGVRLHKSQTLTDWRRRPLSAEQLVYAAEDVRHLPAAYHNLKTRLTDLGRWHWLVEECETLCRETGVQKAEPMQIRRLKGVGSLTGRELVIAQALIAERDILAKELDRPPRVVLKDHLLVELARRGWTDVAKIRSLRGLNISTPAVKRFATAVEAAKKAPIAPVPDLTPEGDSNEEEVLLSLLTAVLRDFCNQKEISYSILASKEDLRRFIRPFTRGDQRGRSPLEHGWRAEAIGSLLVDILDGGKTLRVLRNGSSFHLEAGA